MECEYDKRKKCDSLYIERYNKLLKENEELRKRNKELEEGFKATTEDLCETTLELEKTKSIIKEALEYINWNLDVNEEVIDYFNFDANFNKLLEILDKGV